MDEREFLSEIRRAWSFFRELELARAFSCAVSLPLDNEFKRASLDPDSTYERIFRTGLSRSAYNFLLNDYAYFQFSRSGGSSWRLAYYPNPWLSGIASAEFKLREWEALEERGRLDFEEVSELLAEIPYMNAIPLIRFEICPDSYQELAHPTAHFHIGLYNQNRWASALAIGPLCFSMLIAKMYYFDAWSARSKYCGATIGDCIEKRFLDVVAATTAVTPFSEQERRSLHLGKNLIPTA